ncbi:MAG: hypothetical protein MO846_11810 [Candidatus Devosia symbiotica]|nr:hypothetical protein [Candidatus Devosia symbiotica]
MSAFPSLQPAELAKRALLTVAALVVLAQFSLLLNQCLFADDWLNFVLKPIDSIDLQYFLNA